MKWVTDHLQLIIALAGAVAWWLTQRKGGTAEGGAEAPPPHEEKSFEDPELAERTRRIREEIQRKIEQRAKGYAQEQPRIPRPEPVELPPVLREIFSVPEPPPVAPPAATRQEMKRNAEILEQQATLAEKLREANLMKAAAQKRMVFESATADHTAERRTEIQASLLGELRTPEALRRAFILREVLGPPVALRG